MAKGLRSKCKRKARAEFRSTIGDEFYQKNMAKVQSKLKESLEKQTMSMDSLERLSNALQTTTPEEEAAAMVDTEPSTDLTAKLLSEEHLAAKKLKGENTDPKAIHKKSKKRKHAVKEKAAAEPKEKRRPRYFVQF